MPERTTKERSGRHQQEPVCERCGSSNAVHHDLCRRCRENLRLEGHELLPDQSAPPHQATPRPLRNPPWRRRGA